MATDNFPGLSKALDTPSHRWSVVTPHDTDELAEVPKFLYIGATGGTVTMKGSDGNSATFTVVAGQKVEARPHRVMATGTTAIPIIACY